MSCHRDTAVITGVTPTLIDMVVATTSHDFQGVNLVYL